MREPRLLVLDEPTAVLLPAEIESLLVGLSSGWPATRLQRRAGNAQAGGDQACSALG